MRIFGRGSTASFPSAFHWRLRIPMSRFLWVGSPAREAIGWFQPEIDASGLGDRVRIWGTAMMLRASLRPRMHSTSRHARIRSPRLCLRRSRRLHVVGHQGCVEGSDSLIARHGTLVDRPIPWRPPELCGKRSASRQPDPLQARRAEICRELQLHHQLCFRTVAAAASRALQVSRAVVPNYKYEAYIGERLRSVFDQTYPLREVVVLDDASPDQSVAAITRTAQQQVGTSHFTSTKPTAAPPFRSGARAWNWRAATTYGFAEADDLADPRFVEKLMRHMQAAGSVLGFKPTAARSTRTARSWGQLPPIHQTRSSPAPSTRPSIWTGASSLRRYPCGQERDLERLGCSGAPGHAAPGL